MTDPLVLSEDLQLADARLLATISTLSPADLAAPSLLPGWTRGHVIAHIARNADAFGNLLTWAATGVETPAYASAEARAARIEADAYRPLDVQIEDVREASARLATQVAAAPAESWGYVYGPVQGSAAKIVWRRLREVEVHHVDLGAGYSTADWPEAFTRRLLKELVAGRTVETPFALQDNDGHRWQVGSDDAELTISGPAHALAGWLSGRSAGDELTVSPAGTLPTITDWM